MGYIINSFRFAQAGPELEEIIVAVKRDGNRRIIYSYDGINWNEAISPSDNNASISYQGIIYSPELKRFVTVGQNGFAAYSDDGVNWTTSSALPESNGWLAVAWSPDLELFAACATTGTNRIMTSPNGITWTVRSITSDAYNDITWGRDRFVVVGGSSTSARYGTSTNGTSWSTQNYTSSAVRGRSVRYSEKEDYFIVGEAGRMTTSTNGTNRTVRQTQAGNWWGLAYSPTLERWVTCSSTESTNVMTSDNDGVSWTTRTTPSQNSWVRVEWSEDNELFIAIGQGATAEFMTSPDGITWTQRTIPQSGVFYGIDKAKLDLSNAGTFIATSLGGTNRLMKSLNGINWTAITGGDNGGNWPNITWAKDKGIITCLDNNRGTTEKVMYSTNGVDWDTANIDASDVRFIGATYSPSLGKFVGVASEGTNRVYYSTNGINFSAGSIASAFWYSVIWAEGFGLFIAGGRTGASSSPARIATSSDGETFTNRYTSSNNDGIAVIGYSPTLGTNGRAVALTRRTSNTGRRSDDGTTWTSTMTHANGAWESIAWSPTLNIFVAVSTGTNFAMSSTDGITWTTRTAAQNNAWQNVVWSDYLQMFVAVAQTGTNRVMYSTNGTSWTSASAAEANTWFGLTYTDGLIF